MGSLDRRDISEPIFLMFGSLHQLLYGSAKANLGSLLNEQKTKKTCLRNCCAKKVIEVKKYLSQVKLLCVLSLLLLQGVIAAGPMTLC